MLCRGTGILAIWHDIQPQGFDDFLEWHTREHMPERVGVPGFLRGCRYTAVEGSPQYFNFYQTETPEVLVSEPYLARLNDPTPWTQRVVPFFCNLNRSAGRVVGSVGVGEGGVIGTIRFAPRESAREALPAWFVDSALDEIQRLPGVVAAHLWNADSAASLVETRESRARGNAADVADMTCAIEANSVGYVERAREWLEAQQTFVAAQSAPADFGIYQLQHRLNGAG